MVSTSYLQITAGHRESDQRDAGVFQVDVSLRAKRAFRNFQI
jgi:hypothetical protein